MSNKEMLWNWNYWCRTCGKNDFNQLDSFYNWGSLDDDLLEILKTKFSINLTILEYEGIICINCHTFLNEFLTFSKHCKKLNRMFNEIKLNFENTNDDCDLLSDIRYRYGLDGLTVNQEIPSGTKVSKNNLSKIEMKIKPQKHTDTTTKELIEDEPLIDCNKLMEQPNIYTAAVVNHSPPISEKNKKIKSPKQHSLNNRHSLKRVNAIMDEIDYLMKKDKIRTIENKIQPVRKKKNKTYNVYPTIVVEKIETKQHVRNLLLNYFNSNKTAAEAYRLISYGHPAMVPSAKTCEYWFRRFKTGDFNLNDKERSGSPKKFKNEDLQALLDENPVQTLKSLANTLGVGTSTVSERLKSMGKIPQDGKWISKELTNG